MKNSHKLPYKKMVSKAKGDVAGGTVTIVDAEGDAILEMAGLNHDGRTADFIVHACNNYGGMVEALQCFQRAWNENRLLTSDEAAQMRVALAAAGAA
jgi:hypothetical protein